MLQEIQTILQILSHTQCQCKMNSIEQNIAWYFIQVNEASFFGHHCRCHPNRHQHHQVMPYQGFLSSKKKSFDILYSLTSF